MSTETCIRIAVSFLFASLLGAAVYSKSRRETAAELEENQKRYAAYLPTYLLPVFLTALAVGCLFCYGVETALQMMVSFCFGIFLHISVYYLFLLLVLPLLRKYVSARTCATLWLLPNYLYITTQSGMEVSEPLWILRIQGEWLHVVSAIWLAGFAVVLSWKMISHLIFRHQILRNAKSVTDSSIQEIWVKEQLRAGFKTPRYRLVTSADVSTPLSVGFFPKATRVVLPERQYTPEELTLILRHEVVHIGRRDSETKFFLVFCTAMCWFNPLMWLAMRRSADDLELSCDETVLLDADDQTRRKYADLLLRTAGDERGFTTCLSASASALRYRLGNIVRPRKRFVGGILCGLLFFAMIMSCGYAALAYNDGTGYEYIFNNKEVAEYPITSISRKGETGYQFYNCNDETAFNEYLAELELYQMTGNYSYQSENKLSIFYRCPDGLVAVTVQDHSVTVSPLYGKNLRSESYYCADEIDWDYLDALITPDG